MNKRPILFAITGTFLLLSALFVIPAQAQDGGQPSPPFHPAIRLLDANGVNVLESGNPISTMQTCGSCHDTAFIAAHNWHTDVGLSTYGTPVSGLDWDLSAGLFGEWNPLTYRYLSPEGDKRIDLTTAEWLQVYGPRHVGGGPAVYSRDGVTPLTDLEGASVETQIVDATSGDLVAWDWAESGVVEMNCFLCHLDAPNNAARIATLQAGDFSWANTATLSGSGVVEQIESAWTYNSEAFDPDGELTLNIQDPGNDNCGQCHGLVHLDPQTPLTLNTCSPDQFLTITTGQIFSPQRLNATGLSYPDKDELAFAYDIHAERVVSCVDCHYSLNNPIYYLENDTTRPDHLAFDPRRIELGDYLYRPLHQFAKGSSPQDDLAAEFDDSIRRCEACHNADHDWLPYQDRHMAALACEVCHSPKLYAPARQYNDWTVLTSDGKPETACRGVGIASDTFGTAFIVGFEPVLLPRQDQDGSTTLSPYNLITSWYWVYGDPARPVPYRDLVAAWLDGGTYPDAILDVFDADGDGVLSKTELVIDTDAKEVLITKRLEALGLDNPRIMADTRPYSISHSVVTGEWAIKDCDVCHSDDSRVSAALTLSDRIPGGVIPTFVSNPSTALNGEFVRGEDGSLRYQPLKGVGPVDQYIFGHDHVPLVDWIGAVMFLGVLVSVTGHSVLRVITARRRPPITPTLKREYLYTVYERQWHWLQTAVILILLWTGLIIHKPALFGMFSFRYMVEIHNIMAAILVINAALALFYHLASGEIKQFLPEPHGFVSQAVAQALYYSRGIFRGAQHPFKKSARRKMNPLQQVTYLAILNVLLPAQVITGALMWGAQRWSEVANALGGLQTLAPIHTLVAWSFASFIVAHVYLTTTAGHTPVAGMQAMITGWDELEVHSGDQAPELSGHPAD